MKARETIPLKSIEVLTMCNGYKPLRDANKLLKKRGLILKWRKAGGDQVMLRLEELPGYEQRLVDLSDCK